MLGALQLFIGLIACIILLVIGSLEPRLLTPATCLPQRRRMLEKVSSVQDHPVSPPKSENANSRKPSRSLLPRPQNPQSPESTNPKSSKDQVPELPTAQETTPRRPPSVHITGPWDDLICVAAPAARVLLNKHALLVIVILMITRPVAWPRRKQQ